MFSLEVIQKMNDDWAKKELEGRNKPSYQTQLSISVFDLEKLLEIEDLLEDLCCQYPELEAAYRIVEDLNNKMIKQTNLYL